MNEPRFTPLDLTRRLWKEFGGELVGFRPFSHWEEYLVWAAESKPGYTFSYYRAGGAYGLEEWIILWNEAIGTGKPEAVWRVM